eukprot:XP_001695005.1 predicted protein [Chlamydomonas reinhardtii]
MAATWPLTWTVTSSSASIPERHAAQPSAKRPVFRPLPVPRLCHIRSTTTSVAACQVLNANGGSADLFGITNGTECLALYSPPAEKVDNLLCDLPCDEGTPCGADGYIAVYTMSACRPVFRCKEGIALWGVFLPNTPVKLNPTKSQAENQAHCEELCADNDACQGYYYKTTQWCFQMKEVYSFGKEYSTAIIACKKF